MTDRLSCATARELVSAAADDELSPLDEHRLASHLHDCPGCTAYRDRLAAFTRSIRLRPVHADDDDLTDRIVTTSRWPRLGRGAWLRPALAWVGIVVAAQSFDPLVLGELAGTPTHVARHVGASALALAIGLLYAAWRPERALGLLPLVAALFAATVLATLLDTITGRRNAAAEAVHVAELVGMVLLWLVAGSPGWERVCAALRSLRRDGGMPHPTR